MKNKTKQDTPDSPDPEILGKYSPNNDSLGTKVAAEARARCNNLSAAERQRLLDRGMEIIYGAKITKEQALEGLGNPEDWQKEEEELNKEFNKKKL